jgi:hypothetical protein
MFVEGFQQLPTDAHRGFEFDDERLIERADAASALYQIVPTVLGISRKSRGRRDSGDDDVDESVAGGSAAMLLSFLRSQAHYAAVP